MTKIITFFVLIPLIAANLSLYTNKFYNSVVYKCINPTVLKNNNETLI